MSKVSQRIKVNSSPENTFGILSKFAGFPNYIKGVKRIDQSRTNGDKRSALSEWEVLVNDTVFRWKQEDYFDFLNKEVRFRMLEGDFGNYEGRFGVQDAGDGTSLVLLDFDIDWNMDSAEELIGKQLDERANFAAKWMLRGIKQAMSPSIRAKGHPNSIIEDDLIISEVLSYRNAKNKNIAAYYDHLSINFENNPYVVIAPGYGETKRDSLAAAYFLAANGINVIRYDATNHVGESEGNEIDTSMMSFMADLISSLDYVESRFGVKKIGVVASSLAKRVAVKVASIDKRVALLVGAVGVVDLQQTLKSVYQEDMIGSCLAGKKWETTDVLGLRVRGDFLQSSVRGDFHNLETTLRDAEKLECPVVFLVAEKDAWVNLSDVRIVYERLKLKNGEAKTEFHMLDDCQHNFYENSKQAKLAIKQIVVSCLKYLSEKQTPLNKIKQPSIRIIASQNRIEKEKLKSLVLVGKSEELSFWDEYLTNYYILEKSPDYREYLEDVNSVLGANKLGEKILDAGCGNGHFGAFMMTKRLVHAQGLPQEEESKFLYEYYACDIIKKVLDSSKRDHESIYEYFQKKGHGVPVKLQYDLSDVEKSLPYNSNFFDKACLSLVISYLFKPIESLNEIYRVLTKGGVAAVSSLKPYCDLSVIYKNFVSHAKTEAELITARNLLNNAGIIQQKENQGLYRFFSEQEMKALLITVGFKNIRVIRTFGNQVNLAYGVK